MFILGVHTQNGFVDERCKPRCLEASIQEVQLSSDPFLLICFCLHFPSTPGPQNLGCVLETPQLPWHPQVMEHCRFPSRFGENQSSSCLGLIFPDLFIFNISHCLVQLPTAPIPFNPPTHSLHTHTREPVSPYSLVPRKKQL